jgi:DNA (cytosine-5)-methyltransferase 1
MNEPTVRTVKATTLRSLKTASPASPKFIGVDLFAGAGGMTLGAQAAGIDVAACVENDPNPAETYSHNIKDVTLYPHDVTTWNAFPTTRPGEVKILFGGPPCQGFSTSNQRTRKLTNDNNWLFAEFFRVAEEWRPDWIVFENVKGIAETERGVFLDSVLAQVGKLGYNVTHAFLQAFEFGIPQRRTRLFVVGAPKGTAFAMPTASVKIPLTVWDAISDLPRLKNGAMKGVLPYRSAPRTDYQRLMRGNLQECSGHLVTRNFDFVIERYKHIPKGGNWEDIPDRLMKTYADKTKCHTGIYHRLDEKKPSIVIGNFRKNMLIHPRQDRGLSVREAARLQSFPDHYEFKGSIGFQQQQVGNAVPPLLAKAVFQSVVKAHVASLARASQVAKAA